MDKFKIDIEQGNFRNAKESLSNIEQQAPVELMDSVFEKIDKQSSISRKDKITLIAISGVTAYILALLFLLPKKTIPQEKTTTDIIKKSNKIENISTPITLNETPGVLPDSLQEPDSTLIKKKISKPVKNFKPKSTIVKAKPEVKEKKSIQPEKETVIKPLKKQVNQADTIISPRRQIGIKK